MSHTYCKHETLDIELDYDLTSKRFFDEQDGTLLPASIVMPFDLYFRSSPDSFAFTLELEIEITGETRHHGDRMEDSIQEWEHRIVTGAWLVVATETANHSVEISRELLRPLALLFDDRICDACF